MEVGMKVQDGDRFFPVNSRGHLALAGGYGCGEDSRLSKSSK